MVHDKDHWLEFHFSDFLAWLLALEKYLWSDYHWGLHLDPHLTFQNLELSCLKHCWVCLLGGGLDLNFPGVCVIAAASWISMKLLAGGWVFLAFLSLDVLSHKKISVRDCQLTEFITLSLSTTLLIPKFGGSWRATEIYSTRSIPFTLGME